MHSDVECKGLRELLFSSCYELEMKQSSLEELDLRAPVLNHLA